MKKLYATFAMAALPFAISAQTDASIHLPAGIEPEAWVLHYEYEARFVDIAIDGTDIYLGNLSDQLPDSYVKGTILGDKAVFPITYLGEALDDSWYFVPAVFENRFLDQINDYHEDYYIAPDFTFAYDAEAKTLEWTVEYSAIFVGNDNTIDALAPAWIEYFWQPTIEWVDPEAANAPLANPEFLEAYYDDFMENDCINFYLPSVNTEGCPINTANAYYIFYVNGKPFTFTTDVYEGLAEDMTEIPYNFNDEFNLDIWCGGENHAVALYLENYSTVGVKMFYHAPNGQLLETEYVEADIKEISNGELGGTGGVEGVMADETVATEYFDLYGRKVAEPRGGIYIRVDRKASGSSNASRVIMR